MYSNKKKIRGWKNQVKKIEKWKNVNINLDIESLKQKNRDYLKIWIDPWYRLIKRNPPNWYCKLILKSMIEIYMSCFKTLQEFGEPFYLKIWLYDSNFIKSQIVVATQDAFNFYDNVFEKNISDRRFPYEKYDTKGLELKNFNWERYIEDYVIFEKIDDLSEVEASKLKKRAYKVQRTKYNNSEDVCYRVKIGDILVGELNEIKIL